MFCSTNSISCFSFSLDDRRAVSQPKKALRLGAGARSPNSWWGPERKKARENPPIGIICEARSIGTWKLCLLAIHIWCFFFHSEPPRLHEIQDFDVSICGFSGRSLHWSARACWVIVFNATLDLYHKRGLRFGIFWPHFSRGTRANFSLAIFYLSWCRARIMLAGRRQADSTLYQK